MRSRRFVVAVALLFSGLAWLGLIVLLRSLSGLGRAGVVLVMAVVAVNVVLFVVDEWAELRDIEKEARERAAGRPRNRHRAATRSSGVLDRPS